MFTVAGRRNAKSHRMIFIIISPSKQENKINNTPSD